MQELLKIDKKFTPCLTDDGDELFPNGIFVFNISRISSLSPKGAVELKSSCHTGLDPNS